MPKSNRPSVTSIGFNPTPIRTSAGRKALTASIKTTTFDREIDNPLHKPVVASLGDSAASLIVRRERGILAEAQQNAYLSALQTSAIPSTPLPSGDADSWLSTVAAGASLRRQIVDIPSLTKTKPELACLLLQDLLDISVAIPVLKDKSSVTDTAAITVAISELLTLQTQLRTKEELALSEDHAHANTQLALNHLSLGALALILKKLARRSPGSDSLKSAASWQVANPLRAPKPIASDLAEEGEKSLLGLLAAAALEDLEAHKVDPILLAPIADPSWVNAALGTYFEADSLDEAALMNYLIRHATILRKTRKEPFEVSVLNVLGYALAGAAAAVFMKVKAHSPYAKDTILQADEDSLFTSLAPPRSPIPTISGSAFDARDNSTAANSSASALASSLPSAAARLPTSATTSGLATAQASVAASASPLASALISSSASSLSATSSPSRSVSISSTPSPTPTASALQTGNTWALTLGGASSDVGNALALGTDGSLVMAGTTDSFGAGSQDVLLAKVYANGTLVWAKTLGEGGADSGTALALDFDGSLVVAGSTSSFGAGRNDIFLAKLYSNGSLAWAKTLGGASDDDACALTLGIDGSLVVAGTTYSFGAGNRDILLAKLLVNGTLAWAKTLGGVSLDQVFALALDSDGSLAVTGYTRSFGSGGKDVLLAKLLANGTLAWAKTFGEANDEDGRALAFSSDGSLVLAGLTSSFGAGSADVLLSKWYGNGTLAWAKALGGAGDDEGYALALGADGSLVVTGYAQSFGTGNIDLLLAKLYANGSLAWTKILGGTRNNRGQALALGANDSLAVAGYTTSFGAGSNDLLLAQLNAQGELPFNNTLIQSVNNAQLQSFIPNISDISSAISLSSPALSVNDWNSVISTAIDPFVVYLPASPSPTPTSSATSLPSRSVSISSTPLPTPTASAIQTGNTWALAMGGAGDDQAQTLALDPDGSIVVSGYTDSFGAGNQDVMLAKWHANGSLAWTNTLGGIGFDYGNALALDSDGGIVASGNTDSFGAGNYDVLLAKWYANGSLAWANTLGGSSYDIGNALTIAPDGSITVLGSTYSFGAGNEDVLLAKWYANGTLAWANTLGGTGSDLGKAVALSPDGSIVVSGYTDSFGVGSNDVLLAKYYANGTLAWASILGGASADYGYALAVSLDGSIAVSGYIDSFGAGNNDALLAKYNANGTLAWANTLGGPNSDIGLALALGPDGSIAVSGYTLSFGAGNSDILLTKWYANGTLAWANTLGGANDDVAYAMSFDINGSLIVSGATQSVGAGGNDVLIAYLDVQGQLSVNNSLIRSIPNVQVQSIHPNASIITSLINASSPAFTAQSWNSVLSTNCNPFVVYLPASPSPSATSSPSRLASSSATPSPTPTASAAQAVNTWALAMGGANHDISRAVAVDADGSIVVSGYTDSFGAGSYDILLAKWHANGTLTWANTLGGASDDQDRTLAISPDGSIIVSGITQSFGAGGWDLMVAKYYTNGSLAWANTLGGTGDDDGYAMALSPDGSIVITGYTTSFGAGGADILLAKWYANGTLAWANTLGGTSNDYGYALAISLDGSMVISGSTHNVGTMDWDAILAKWYANGTLAWAKSLGGLNDDHGYELVVDHEGSMITTGYTNSFGAENYDALLSKWYPNGTLVWSKTLGGAGNDYSLALAIGTDGSLMISGYTNSSGAGLNDVLLAKWYANDTLAWVNTLGGSSDDIGWALANGPNGSIVVAGSTSSFGAGNYDLLLAYLDARGQLAVNNSLIRPLINAQVQSIHPNVSDITSLVSVSSPAFSAQSWNSVISTSINPGITYLATSLPSSSPARRRLAPNIFAPERVDNPQHRWLRPEPSAEVSARPLSTRLAAQLRSTPGASNHFTTERQGGSNTYGSFEMAAGMAGLCLMLLFIWRLVGGANSCGRFRRKYPAPQAASLFQRITAPGAEGHLDSETLPRCLP